MIKFLLDNDYDVPQEFIYRNIEAKKLAQIPFDQELKRMSTIRIIPNQHY